MTNNISGGERVGKPRSGPAHSANAIRPASVEGPVRRPISSTRERIEDVLLVVALIAGLMVCAHLGLAKVGM